MNDIFHSTNVSPMIEDHRLLSESGIRAIFDRVLALRSPDGEVGMRVNAWWRGGLRWARNRVSMASDQRDIEIELVRQNKTGYGFVVINQIDDASLKAALYAAERRMNIWDLAGELPHDGLLFTPPSLPFPETAIWSDSTFQVTPDQRADFARTLTEGAEDHGLLAAGYLQMRVYESQKFGFELKAPPDRLDTNEPSVGTLGDRTARTEGYRRHCEAQCSMTVRHPRGLGSGWAGISGYDWSALDPAAVAKQSLDKCIASLNAVGIEPGRYTVILEPQATAWFASQLVRSLQKREEEEGLRRPGPWSLDVDPTLGMRMTKLGLKVIDERITIKHDPMDPRLGTAPELGMQPVTWIENGVLKNLSYGRGKYALNRLRENIPVVPRDSFVMSGGTTSMDEMIATTKRGIIVTRLSNGVGGAGSSMLMSAFTRDGLWLVENGKISKAIRNMRCSESPLFVFNQVEQLGVPVPVFSPGEDNLEPKIVPPIKTRDFAFTATIDAV